jgi:microcystin-dependent protein
MSQTKAELLSDSFGSNATGTIPIGGIIMWSGTITSIPTGWNLCNGTNGTPDLRNKFVVGAWSDGSNTTYPNVSPGATGGNRNATVVSHTHTLSNPYDSTPKALFMSIDRIQQFPPLDAINGLEIGGNFDDPVNNVPTSSVSRGNINSAGTSGTNANLPPYYAIAYIMRVS